MAVIAHAIAFHVLFISCRYSVDNRICAAKFGQTVPYRIVQNRQDSDTEPNFGTALMLFALQSQVSDLEKVKSTSRLGRKKKNGLMFVVSSRFPPL
jgi:hypothetical protein